ncbi:MAG: hypothetical protein ACRC2T_17070, partial [Thermoguttaceae bacterium]
GNEYTEDDSGLFTVNSNGTISVDKPTLLETSRILALTDEDSLSYRITIVATKAGDTEDILEVVVPIVLR